MDDEGTYLPPSSQDFDEELTKRELLVLKLSAKGDANKIIAGKICRCIKQVEHDIANIFIKLHVTNMKQAIDKGWKHGILTRENH